MATSSPRSSTTTAAPEAAPHDDEKNALDYDRSPHDDVKNVADYYTSPYDNEKNAPNHARSRYHEEKNAADHTTSPDATPHDEENPPAATGREKDDLDPFQVRWEAGDSQNPRGFSTWRKAGITFLLGMIALSASLGSSIVAPAGDAIAAEFDTSSEVLVLGVSLYILGFAFGPLVWAPISEIWGRRWSILPAMFGLGLFSIGSALGPNIQTVLVTRFFGGVFGSAPVSNVGAAMGDLYDPEARGMAVTFYAICVVGGPTFGPVIGSALVENMGWRWTEWIEAIWVFTVTVAGCVFLPELYEPALLKRKAQRLRAATGDPRWFHPHERIKLDPRSIVTKHFTRPLRMLVTEPMVTAIALYASFVYALLYMALQILPIIFQQQRGWAPIPASLPFLAMFIGICCAAPINLGNQPYYHRAVARNRGRAVPEARLPPVVIGSVLFCGGLFWLGWNAAPQYHWILPCLAIAFVGAGFNTIFQQCINFLIDTYALYAASAVSANTFLRSVLAAGLPLAVKPMFAAMGTGPAMSLLGGVAALALPVPWLFMKYGLALRRRSKFAPVDED